jgi:hypothetical protein
MCHIRIAAMSVTRHFQTFVSNRTQNSLLTRNAVAIVPFTCFQVHLLGKKGICTLRSPLLK